VSYTFKVEAVGPTGQVSSNGPGTTVSTSDLTEPAWDVNATLTADATVTTVALSWTAATDNVAVDGYEIFMDGGSLATVAGDVTTYDATGLVPGTLYDFQVQASDGAGNVTLDGPTVQISTLGGVLGHTDEDVMDSLQPTCNACHSTWFSSLESFQSKVVNVAKLITPGDPDNSLIILYMEENGPGAGQMPPSFFDPDGDSYLDMSNKGETLLTVQELRSWISAM
jgi:chitodextrinase